MRVDYNFEQILFEVNESFLMLAPETRIGEKLSSFPPPSLSFSLLVCFYSFFLFSISSFSLFFLPLPLSSTWNGAQGLAHHRQVLCHLSLISSLSIRLLMMI